MPQRVIINFIWILLLFSCLIILVVGTSCIYNDNYKLCGGTFEGAAIMNIVGLILTFGLGLFLLEMGTFNI